MRLFELNKYWELEISPEAYGYPEFAKIVKRDKSKGKKQSTKELLYVYHFCDLRSNYLNIADEDKRSSQIKEEIELAPSWEPDSVVEAAMYLYRERSATVIGNLYESALVSTNALSSFLRNTESLLTERDKNDKPVYKPQDITSSIKKIPELMADLKKAEKEFLQESKTTEGKSKGSQDFNEFEDGLELPD